MECFLVSTAANSFRQFSVNHTDGNQQLQQKAGICVQN